MVELWAADRATGSGVRTACQARRQRVGPRVSVDLNQNVEYIPEQPQWAIETQLHHHLRHLSMNIVQDRLNLCLPSHPVELHPHEARKGRHLWSMSLILNLITVRQVSTMEDRNEILRSQTEILRRTPNYTYTEADINEMLSAMNIANENLLEQCYDFLCGNPTCTKRLMGLPPHKRWNKLCKMISGGDC
ncbi:hypothetical protein LR48_Vigan03g173100 [Vigna angularis]|uniref:Uncharacterized protein n=1 Tax=Phaseolus angularis TaxID=3914 RepID=A0A0L9U7C9_PHAAN|nr:hypothetical protein LR48_Vigan03g173100 [Vigna angularis]